MKYHFRILTALALPLLTGCSHNDQPVMMAPPTTPVTISQSAGQGQVYNWTDVPAGQQVPIQRAVFDQGGYQLYSDQGTIVVPFANQNLYVMKFGQSASGGMYFVNDGKVPTLYIPAGGFLDNVAQPGAHWYPFPQNYAYTQPVYVGLAPSWSAFSGMGWYPGMSYYGGYWGNSPYSLIGPMIGLHFLIGGSPYYGWNSYHSYYSGHPYGYAPIRVVNRTVYNQARTSFNSGGGVSGRRSFGSAGSTFGSNRSFGSNRPFGSGSVGSSGSFGGGRSSFGTSAPHVNSGSFGSGPSGFGGSFGTGRRSSPVFGGGSSGSSFGSRPSGGFFGGGGGSFGGGHSSFGGGGSFGGGHSSFGGGRHR